MELPDQPPTLDYHASLAGCSVRRLLIGAARLTIVGVGIVVLALLYHWYRPQVTAYLGQRDVEAVIAPPGAVLYSNEPETVMSLAGQVQYAVSNSRGNSGSHVERLAAWYNDPDQPSAKFRSGMPPIGLRRVRGGPWRLIDLGGGEYEGALFPVYDVLSRATLRPGSRPKQLWYGIPSLSLARADRITLLAGQLDPADDAHFTFDYLLNGLPGTVDGRLGKDDNVTFAIRSGPATTRPYKVRSGRQSYP